MDEHTHGGAERCERTQDSRCIAELHLQLCARRLPSGHLQFTWGVDHSSSIDEDGESLEGVFGPFQLPHEMGQEVATIVRRWIKEVAASFRRHAERSWYDDEGQQLTLSDFLAD